MTTQAERMNRKYVFTDEHFAPICIAYYQDDDTAAKECDKLSEEMSKVINVCRVVAKSKLITQKEKE